MSDIEATKGLLADAFGRVREGVAELTTGLTDETAWWRPDGEANSIAWLLWHLTRVQDDHVVGGLSGGAQVWPQFRDEAGLPLDPDDTGYGHTDQQVGLVRVSADLLDRYHATVHAATLRYLDTLDEAELERIVDERWDPPVTAAVRLVSVIDDCAKHLGQADYARGLADRHKRSLDPLGGGRPMNAGPDALSTRGEHRFYGDLAPWWPLISPPEEYAEEADFAASLLSAGGATRTVLELGSGGGHVASHLAGRFTLTLVDLSEPMLAVSRALNPGAAHHQGDMRTVRLGEQFDAVLIHDAIDYMTTEDDLRRAIETAYAHVRPGGIAVLVPDDITESFEQRTAHGGSDAADGRAARYLEWSWDPDPDDSWTITNYTFVLREANGSVETAHETHRLGLFPRDTWLRLLTEAGFTASAHNELATGDDHPRTWFVGRRALSWGQRRSRE